MGIKQLYNDDLRKLPNEYGDVSVMQAKYQIVSSKAVVRVDKSYSYLRFALNYG